jgi:serine/threonine-protein kinase
LTAEERALADLAASVADGDQVEWSAASARVAERDRRLVRHLKLVESISQVYRTIPADDIQEVSPDEAAVERWGTLLLLERIGEGMSGEVHRAWDSRLHRDVAVKLLHPVWSGGHHRVLDEARRLARVRHEHVVQVYGAEEHDGRVGLWMELVRGESLDERVRARGPLKLPEAAQIGRQLCAALSAVHGVGLLHRDVKAQNVILEHTGRTVLMDFGTGEELRRSTGTNRMVGTPLYLAPEIFKGQAATAQSDIYSAGVLLFYLVTGELPVAAASMQDLGRAHAAGTRRRLSEMRPELGTFATVVDRALDPVPARRFSSAREMETALERAAATEHEIAAEREGLRGARGRWAFGAVALALIAVITALIVWTRAPANVAPAPITAIAVAPMTTINTGPAPPFFAEGLTDQLIATLGQIRSLRIKSLSPLRRGHSPDQAALASVEQVDAVLQTSLLVAGAGGSEPPRTRRLRPSVHPSDRRCRARSRVIRSSAARSSSCRCANRSRA